MNKRNRKFTLALAAFMAALVWWSWDRHAPASFEKNEIAEREHEEKEHEAGGAKWFAEQRMYPLGYIPQDAEIKAVDYVRQQMIPALGASLKKSAAAQLNWKFEGPGNIGGRLRGILVHPSNPNILYVGSVSGGVWKSLDAGKTWTPTMNDLITLNVTALAMKPGDSNTLYAGTGEAYFTGDCLPGRGLLKTTDGGQTWKRIHVAQGLNTPFITEIAVSPANPNVVYVSGRKAVPRLDIATETIPDPGVSAIFKSIDSGETWQNVTSGKGIEHDPNTDFDDFGADVVISPTDANTVYATFGIHASGGIWKSTNGGQTWTRLTSGLPDPNQPNQGYNRIELAMAPSNPSVLYASFSYLKKDGDTIDLKNEGMLGLWKTTNAGQSWAKMTTPLTINQRNRDGGLTTPLGQQGTYDNAITVHPTDPNTVFVAGLDCYKSTDGGNTWAQISMWIPPDSPENPEKLPYLHADHHVFAFDRSTNPPALYNGSDGGIFRSRDLGKNWERLNNDLGVTQFYTFAVHPTNAKIMIGGAQDNGTPMTISGSVNTWFEAANGGDGWTTFFDPNNPATVYTSVYNVSMLRLTYDYATGNGALDKVIGFTDGSNGITKDDVDNAGFFSPYEMSPNNSNVLVLGTYRLLKSANRGDSWTAISGSAGGPIAQVAIAEGNDNIIWLATKTARIFKTEDGGNNYTNVNGANLPDRFVTDIEFDPSNNRTVYLTYSGYGSPHVFKTTDAGASWTNITNNLPDAPANTIQVHPNQPNVLFLGTDVGVFISENGGQTWQPSATNFPTVPVVAIVLNTRLNRIWAATHGRGAYSAELSSSAATLSVDTQEINIGAKPNQNGSATFKLSNTGTAALSYNITTTGNFGALGKASLADASRTVDLSRWPRHAANEAPPMSSSYQMLSPQARLLRTQLGSDELVLDDGGNEPDTFIGFGSGSTMPFNCLNVFKLGDKGFKLESVKFYMRSESSALNFVTIQVLDANNQKIHEEAKVLSTSENGQWFTVPLFQSYDFSANSTFKIVLQFLASIEFPMGTDAHAQVPNNSFYLDNGVYVNLNTAQGFENGAFLIRAVGTLGTVNQPPIAKGTISKTQAAVNETLTFDASQSSDPDGQITQYLWEFGDGASSNQKIATHAYSQVGAYTVKLTVTDNQGATASAQGQVTIVAGNQAPVARASVSPNPAKVNQSTTFDASASSDPDGQITQYLWTFGDGATSTQKIATKAYTQAGNYNVTLKVTDNAGATGQTSVQVTVTSDVRNRLSVSPASGNVAPNGSQTITVTLDGQALAEGNYTGSVSITSNGGNQTIPVKIKISATTGVEESAELPRAFRLEQNYPNPFRSEATSRLAGNPETMIRYELPQASNVSLVVFDLNGRRLAQLASGLQTAGVHLTRWNGRDDSGNRVPSGIYFYRLEAAEANGALTTLTKKLTVMK